MNVRGTAHCRAMLLAVVALSALVAKPAFADDPASISGVVTDAASGRGMGSVCVVAFDHARFEDNEREVRTAGDGSYEITGLPTGLYSVFVNHRCDGTLPDYAADQYGRALDVREGIDLEAIDVGLDPASRLNGRIVDEQSGAPIADICVSIWDEVNHSFAPPERTDATGRWSIERLAFLREGETVAVPGGGLPSGAYLVAFDDCRAPPLYVSERHADRTEEDPDPWADPVWVPVGTAVTVDAALSLGGAIVGLVSGDHSGEPLQSCVSLWPDGAEEPRRVIVTGEAPGSAPGRYTFGGLPPGTYRVAFDPAVCGGGTVEAEWWDGAAERSAATPIDVRPGALVRADASLAPQPALPGSCPPDAGVLAALRFDDVATDDPHAASIGCLLARGLVSGTQRHTFAPAASITRGQAATVLAGALEHIGALVDGTVPDAFRDDDGSVHEPALDRLAAAGIMLGRAPGLAAPSAELSRGQAASLVVRAYELTTSIELLPGPDRFRDDDASIHEATIDGAALAGLVSGRTRDLYEPDRRLTRAQAVTLVGNLLGRAERDLAGLARG